MNDKYSGLLPPYDYTDRAVPKARPAAPAGAETAKPQSPLPLSPLPLPYRSAPPEQPIAGPTPRGHRSLEEVHRSVAIPKGGHWLRRMFAFAGPAYMVSVGYMDPGNWATDLEGGARFGYALLWVLLMSNLMAVLLQTLSARLGLVTGRDLAQACRDAYSTPVRWILFILCEIAIAACDLAEVLGTAIGINLLTAMFLPRAIPLEWAIVITAADVFILLAIQRFGIRKMEAFILGLVFTIGMCFIIEIFLSKPAPTEVVRGLVPSKLSGEMLLVAIGILGATVMPHNLYLHSALVQSRDIPRTEAGVRQANKFNFLDSAIALNCAFFVNAAILIVAAATFHKRGIVVAEIQQAHAMLQGVLGTRLAPTVFAIALICAGQSSTLTGTLAGQITMEGFLQFRIRPWLRRLITRSLAIIPAVLVIWKTGEGGSTRLLVISQVILSLQLPFAVVPLVKFTSSRAKMGKFVSPMVVTIIAWLVTSIIVYLNAKLVIQQIGDWAEVSGRYQALVWATASPVAAALGLLLAWMTFRPEGVIEPVKVTSASDVAAAAARITRSIRRVGVALQAERNDAPMIAEAIALARSHAADLLLLHVVEGVGGQYHGPRAGDVEFHEDARYLRELAQMLSREPGSAVRQLAGVRASTGGVDGADQLRVGFALGYGDVRRELIRLARENNVDLLVMGGHGHRAVMDILRGTTIDGVRHGLKIPVLAVREPPE